MLLRTSCPPCVFLGFPLDVPGWQFYHPTSRRVLSSQDVTFDESVSYYRLFPYLTASPPPPPLFLAPGAPPVDPLPPQGPAPSGVSQVDPIEPVEVAVDSGAARGAEPVGAGTRGAEPGVAESEGAEPGATGGAVGAGAAGAAGPRGAGAGGTGAVGESAGVGTTGAAGAAGPGGARTGGTGAAGARGAAGVGAVGAGVAATGGAAGAGAAGGTRVGGAAGVVAGDPGAEGTGAVSAVSGGATWPRPYYVPLLQQVLGLPPSPGPTPLLSPLPVQSQLQLQLASPLPGPSAYSGPTRGLTERRMPVSCPTSPESCPASLESRLESPVCAFRTGRRVPRQRPPPVHSTHSMTLSPSTAPLRVPLLSPPASSLPDGPDPESDSLRAASPILVDFVAACRLDCAASLVAQSESAFVCPRSVGGECALCMDILEDRQEEFECFAIAVSHLVSMLLAPEGDPDAPDIPTPRSYAEAIEGPYSSQWQTAMDTEMASWKSTGTYVEERTTLAALVFAPSTSDLSLFLRTDTSLPQFYVLVYADDLVFATADTEALAHVKLELQKRHTCTDLGELTSYLGLQITWDRAQRTITLTQSHMVQQVLQRFGFTYSSPLSTPLPTGHSLSAPPSNESVEPSGPYPELVGCLMYLMTCTRPNLTYPLSLLARYVAPGKHGKVHWDAAKRVLRYLCSTLGMGLVLGGRARVVLTGHADASWSVDLTTHRSSQGYTFSLGSGSVSWRSTRPSSVLSSSCEAEIYVGAMAAQELRWLTYLLTNLGEPPRSPPVLYGDIKAMIALC
ncbi:unnamed protein product [Closterium sp. NIES-53]